MGDLIDFGSFDDAPAPAPAPAAAPVVAAVEIPLVGDSGAPAVATPVDDDPFGLGFFSSGPSQPVAVTPAEEDGKQEQESSSDSDFFSGPDSSAEDDSGSAAEEPSSGAPAAALSWFWENDKGKTPPWVQYDADSQDQLSRALEADANAMVQFSSGFVPPPALVFFGVYPPPPSVFRELTLFPPLPEPLRPLVGKYEVDLGKMLQKQLRSGFTRPIKFERGEAAAAPPDGKSGKPQVELWLWMTEDRAWMPYDGVSNAEIVEARKQGETEHKFSAG
jgi:hypothetical protein